MGYFGYSSSSAFGRVFFIVTVLNWRVMKVTWIEPPKQPRRYKWIDHLEPLQERPGVWAHMRTYKTPDSARKMAYRLRNHKDIQEGLYEFQTTQTDLYARFVGEVGKPKGVTQTPPPVKRQRKPDYDAFKDYWNAVIPPHWSQCIQITDTRQRLIKQLYEDVGVEAAFGVFTAGVDFCVNDGWWLGKDGISIANIMSNGKLVGLAEKQQAKQAKDARAPSTDLAALLADDVTGQQGARVTAPVDDLATVLADDYGHN